MCNAMKYIPLIHPVKQEVRKEMSLTHVLGFHPHNNNDNGSVCAVYVFCCYKVTEE